VFYYWIEAAIAPLPELTSNDDTGKLEFIGCINGTPSLDGGISYFEGGHYIWSNKASSYVYAMGMLSDDLSFFFEKWLFQLVCHSN
jgi:hypothetical protein